MGSFRRMTSGDYRPGWLTSEKRPFQVANEDKEFVCEVHCPLTGRVPDVYLFSSWDTRFGDKRTHHLFYSTQSCLAITAPLIEQADLDQLYRQHYSNSQPQVIVPDGKTASPFKDYRKSALLSRVINSPLLPRMKSVLWDNRTCQELLSITDSSFPRCSADTSFLDIGCFDGRLLQELQANTQWRLTGVEPNSVAVQEAQEKGLSVYAASAEHVDEVIPGGMHFDIIFLGQTIEHLLRPLETVKNLSTLLKSGGELIISTPNLCSSQIKLFGPTWSHWHPPYHRFVFSVFSLKVLGEKAGLVSEEWKSHSHPYWSALSLQLNDTGLRGAAPHGRVLSRDIRKRAERVVFLSRHLWDPNGGGDYIYMAFRKK